MKEIATTDCHAENKATISQSRPYNLPKVIPYKKAS